MRTLRVAAAGAMLTLLPGMVPTAPLELSIAGTRSARGVVRLCLTSRSTNFPRCTNDADRLKRSVPAGQHVIRIEGLPLGSYAAAVVHDENGNARLDTLLGVPREGFGFSRDPAIRFGPPRFSAARFSLDAGGTAQRITMKYLL